MQVLSYGLAALARASFTRDFSSVHEGLWRSW
jgi:hypothetical protein